MTTTVDKYTKEQLEVAIQELQWVLGLNGKNKPHKDVTEPPTESNIFEMLTIHQERLKALKK